MSLQAMDKITRKTLRNERIRLKMSAKLGLNFKLVFHQLYMVMLMIDYSYYLAKQILPPIERLCAPIDCTDSARIAECLGFDPRQFRSVGPISPTERTIEPLESRISDEERFRDADQLFIKCISCSESHPFTGISSSKVHISCFSITNSRIVSMLLVSFVLMRLAKPTCRYSPSTLNSKLKFVNI